MPDYIVTDYIIKGRSVGSQAIPVGLMAQQVKGIGPGDDWLVMDGETVYAKEDWSEFMPIANTMYLILYEDETHFILARPGWCDKNDVEVPGE